MAMIGNIFYEQQRSFRAFVTTALFFNSLIIIVLPQGNKPPACVIYVIYRFLEKKNELQNDHGILALGCRHTTEFIKSWQ